MDNSSKRVSILYPTHISADYHIVSEVSLHDLGMDSFVKDLTDSETEQKAILKILSKITDNASLIAMMQDMQSRMYAGSEPVFLMIYIKTRRCART